MKKLALIASAAMVVLVAFAGVAQAIVINSGPFGGKYSDNTYADFNFAETGGLPLAPGQTAGSQTGNVWGIVSLTGIHTLLDGNPENNALSGVAYYTPGSDGKYYFGVYGGLTLLSGTAPGEQHLGPASGITPFLNIYETTNPNLYDLSVVAGPNVPSAGQFGTFGVNIIYGADGLSGTADDPTLWLQTTFSPGTICFYSPTACVTDPTTLEIITNSSSVTGSAEAYLDILGGTGAALFEKGVFPLANPAFPFRADLKVISDLTTQFNGGTGEWTSPFGWTTNSQDPITGVGASAVPEPSTIMLLGAGLLGIGIIGRRRTRD